jgi:hypothetical protein
MPRNWWLLPRIGCLGNYRQTLEWTESQVDPAWRMMNPAWPDGLAAKQLPILAEGLSRVPGRREADRARNGDILHV